MKTKRVHYRELLKVLQRVGYIEGTTQSKYRVFRHPESRLPIVLPRMKWNAVVPPVELLSIRNVLKNAGFWGSLLRQSGTKSPEEAVHVLQTLAGVKRDE